ncbi:EAL domain-containing protein [Acinetobacter nectaris]|uniref:bifunctional diguanylate cyclase/phosphodiesterase n=1 Tax=Acinetobacter nectaris TaxID=1219382 RepID=UPI001F3F90B8|nr:EAL domain-containing protein [Acinetobacter nectaris]MCF8998601.1 EAL domain-containing protein [Acinetobacter nectaris]MCF9027715.1 EAL domain-containing protein [Acinetobacter nectaris]
MFALGYDFWLVIGSVLVTLITCYATFATERILFKHFYNKKDEKLVVLTTGILLSASIWCMHFIAIFACQYPDKFHFDVKLVIASYLIALLASIFSIWLTTRPQMSFPKLVLGAFVLGAGIIGMHYTGQFSIHIEGYIFDYDEKIVLASMVWAVLGSGCTLWIAYKVKTEKHHVLFLRCAATVLLTSTIIGLHYLGMAASNLYKVPGIIYSELPDQDNTIVVGLIFIVFAVFVMVLFICLLEGSLEKRNNQLHQANKKLKHFIFHDHLTQLPNRSYLVDYAKITLSEHRLHRQKLAVLFIDLDRFKSINDAFGNYIGDELLIQFANKMSQFASHNKKVFRISGDEFLFVAEHTNLEQAELLAQSILENVQDGFSISGHTINITLSIGIAIFPDSGENLQNLMMHADIAKLVAKEQGRNTYSVFDYQTEEYAERHQSKLMNDLFSAIGHEQFILLYQPKFDQNKNICGVEALIRWQHPTLGLLTPNKFIPLAEKTGFIIPIGYWVLDQACKQISLWEKQGLDLYPISINLSALQIEHKNLIQTLEEKITQYEIDPNHLMIEVTETTAMHHIDFSIHIFKKIRELGVGLSIDDFGTGHSSFLYLKDLPVNELKIDRAFIKNLEPHSKDEAILDSIIKLTQHLGLSITVEGVETEAQFEILKRLGCYSFQGFLLGKPVPKEVLKIQFLSSKIAANAMKKH